MNAACQICGTQRDMTQLAVESRKFCLRSARCAVNIFYCPESERCHYGAIMRAAHDEQFIREHVGRRTAE